MVDFWPNIPPHALGWGTIPGSHQLLSYGKDHHTCVHAWKGLSEQQAQTDLSSPGFDHEFPGQMRSWLRLQRTDHNGLVQRVTGNNLEQHKVSMLCTLSIHTPFHTHTLVNYHFYAHLSCWPPPIHNPPPDTPWKPILNLRRSVYHCTEKLGAKLRTFANLTPIAVDIYTAHYFFAHSRFTWCHKL